MNLTSNGVCMSLIRLNYVFVVKYDQPRTLGSSFLNKQYPWPWSVMKMTSNDIQQAAMVLIKLIWLLVAFRCPRVVIHGRIGLIFGCFSSLHQDESFDISNTFLRHLEVLEIIGTLVTLKKCLFCPYHVTHVTFYHFFSARPTKSTMLNSIMMKKVYVDISQELTIFIPPINGWEWFHSQFWWSPDPHENRPTG